MRAIAKLVLIATSAPFVLLGMCFQMIVFAFNAGRQAWVDIEARAFEE